MHLHFIINPEAGGGDCARRFEALTPLLLERGASYSVAYSEYAGHCTQLAKEAVLAGRERVVAVGGDGTVGEVATALAHTPVALGILPMGTGNDMIRSLDIPRNLPDALNLLLDGTPRKVDAATANGQFFLNVAGLGFDVAVIEKTVRWKSLFRARLAYLLGLAQALGQLRSHKILLTVDGVQREEEVILVAVGNGSCIGGGMLVTPLADPSDGLLDVCVIRKVGVLKVLRCLTLFMRGRHIKLDFVDYFRTETLRIDCAQPLPMQLDGEISASTPAQFQVLPEALMVITSRVTVTDPEVKTKLAPLPGIAAPLAYVGKEKHRPSQH